MRLDKYLADAGVGTRANVKKYIKKGMVTVDQKTVTDPGEKVDENSAEVFLNGKRVEYHSYEYFMLNKPQGIITASTDKNAKTVVDLIDVQKRRDLFPVGRLDKDTEGLLLITNDGVMASRLLKPGRHVDKLYFARIDGEVSEKEIELFREGVDIGDDTLTKPAKLCILNVNDGISEIEITITEGRYHQIKRMFEAVGMEVIFLKRLSMGPLKLDAELEPGEFRPLSEEELSVLQELTANKNEH